MNSNLKKAFLRSAVLAAGCLLLLSPAAPAAAREPTLGPIDVGGLSLAWRAHVGTTGASSPVYANGKLFVGTASGLVGLDPATGAIIINYRSGPVSTTPAVIRGFDPQPDPPGKVIFGSSDGVLHAVSTAGGRELWRVALGASPAGPLMIQSIGDPTIRIILGAGRTLFALDANGRQLWATRLEGGDISAPAAVAPAAPDRVVAAAGNALYALDTATGAVLWRTVPSGAVLGAPAIGDPHILVGDRAGHLFSLDPRGGAVVAVFQARGPVLGAAAIGDPHIAAPWIFVGDGDGDIYALDQTDGFPPPIWQAALGGPVDGPPVLANGVVYVATDPDLGHPGFFALDQATGRVLFEGSLPGGAASGALVAGGRVVVATSSGDVLAYDGPDS